MCITTFRIMILILTTKFCFTYDYLPCTENVDDEVYALAQRILDQHIPPGYRLIELNPVTQTGRNPHRWLCRYERLDNEYRQDCNYLTDVRQTFKNHCPARCEISQVQVADSPIRRFISVEILVNCRCTKIPRRRRSAFYNLLGAYNNNFETEHATCTGFSMHKW